MCGGWKQQIKDVRAEHVTQIQVHMGDGDVVTATNRAARELHRAVRSRMRDEIARLRLEHPGRIPVRWSPTGRPVRSPAEALGVQGMALTGDVNQVPEFLRGLPRRQLVVLGPQGAGKSVLALLLAWDLLKTWQLHEPVPVVLSLSSWRPEVGLREWMARRIRELGDAGGHGRGTKRRAGKNAAARLVDENRVMPVLDGLDELPPALHASAVEAIDAAVVEGVPLLLTCRGDEYERAVRDSGSHLTRAAVVELEPVTPTDAITYLEQSTVTGDRRWEEVFDALRGRHDSALATALSSPLMLYLARTAYQAGSTDPGELLGERFGTREEIESHLLKRYLPAVYAESPVPPAPRFAADRVRRYLTTVALQMRRDRTLDFAWWQVHSPVTGPVVAAAFGCAYGWFLYLLFGALQAALSALMTGVAGYGVHAVVRVALIHVYVTEDVLRGPRGVLRQYALIALLSALAVGSVTGAAVGGWLSLVLGAPAGSVLGFGVLVGGAAGAAALLGSAWGSYQVSRTWFCLTGRLPWRLWAFLDNAHELGVLRQTGAVHQFRHLRVREQLSGGGDPSGRSVHSGRTAARRWRYVLPVLPSVAQALLVLAWLFVTGYVNVAGPAEALSLRSGDWPERELEACEGYCRRSETWYWNLPQGESRQASLRMPNPEGPSFTKWYGLVGARGCTGAAVEVTLQLGDRPPVSFVLAAGNGPRVDVAPKVPVPEPVRLKEEPIVLTLRRVDEEPCDLSFSWADAGLRRDGMELARKRFGIPSPHRDSAAVRG
ncbi:NACHT domain-containing protein [Streptomyces sp. NPDC060028]|uniref:NACHT domain-containing protein n=1 Tax=Streptomyces sp. NPDC060028 TaxID=3347041 RepID=UPI0036968DC1